MQVAKSVLVLYILGAFRLWAWSQIKFVAWTENHNIKQITIHVRSGQHASG
jgi:hypothetical protein